MNSTKCLNCGEEIYYQPVAGWYHKGGDKYYPEPRCDKEPDEETPLPTTEGEENV